MRPRAPYAIERAAVIGAGTMGCGIAGQLANAGVPVLLLDVPGNADDRNAPARRAVGRLLDERQPGLLHPEYAERITPGNIEDDLARVGEADWIAEAVVERLDVKRALYRDLDRVRKPGSMVTSNTSTLPLSLLVEGMPAAFRREFAITHFFNPVRFMRLLELVRGEDTADEVMASLEAFCDHRLGKGVVVCRDTPGFLGNRVGVFAIQTALHQAFRMGLTPEQADAVFGRPMGVPKTGVFGLYDLIGIDLMADVVRSLVANLPADDPFHAVAAEIPVMRRMIETGRIGNKSQKGGFYRRAADGRKTLDFEAFEYRPHAAEALPIAGEAELQGAPSVLMDSEGWAADYAWEILASTLSYAAWLVPGVSESPAAIDDAMKLGYNWLRGPFEMLDAIGVEAFVDRLQREGRPVPDFLAGSRTSTFYRIEGDTLQERRADGAYRRLRRAPGIRRFSEERRFRNIMGQNDRASYFDLGEGLGLVEFHSKANTLDADSMALLAKALEHASENMQGLVVHNDSAHFSCGVNLAAVLDFIDRRDFDGLDRFLIEFQTTVIAMRDAPVPVVAAPVGLALGGGFEVVLHADRAVFHANSVTGLVESLVGLVPGGGGVKEMLYRLSDQLGDPVKAAWQAFMQIGFGKTASSPLLAAEMAMFRHCADEFLMNRDRQLERAAQVAISMAEGYRPTPRAMLAVAGRAVRDEMADWLTEARDKGRLETHDVTVGGMIAMIVTGGNVPAGSEVSEQTLLDLERAAFLSLAGTDRTRARIAHMLEHGRPLRN